jgi:hypothetical protein
MKVALSPDDWFAKATTIETSQVAAMKSRSELSRLKEGIRDATIQINGSQRAIEETRDLLERPPAQWWCFGPSA